MTGALVRLNRPSLSLTQGREATVARLLAAFFQGKSPHTLRAYTLDLEDFTAFLRRAFLVALSHEEMLRMFLSQGVGSANEIVLHYRSDLQERKRAPSTINRRLAAIKSLVKLGRMIGLVTWEVEVAGVRNEARRDTRGPGVENVNRMLEKAQTQDGPAGLRNVAMLRLFHDLALRVSEVVRLDRTDFLPETSGLWVLGKARTEKELLRIPDVTKAALDAWLAVRGSRPGPIFTSFSASSRDERLTTRGLYRIVRNLAASIGLRVWPHGLRHTSITTAVIEAPKRGIGLEEVRQFSRHKNVNTLLIYRDQTRDVQGTLADVVADALGQQKQTDEP